MPKLLDVLLNSNQLKRTIVERAFKYNIPIRYLCNEVGVDYKMFMSTYINSTSGDPKYITEEQFTNMLSLLGIETRFQFVISSDYDGNKIGQELSEKNEKKRGTKTDS